MTELPPLHFRHAVALTDLIGRTGATDLELGYLSDTEPYGWWAKANYAGRRLYVEHHAVADLALVDLARRIVDGGTCLRCERTVTFGYTRDGYCSRTLTMRDDEYFEYVRSCE